MSRKHKDAQDIKDVSSQVTGESCLAVSGIDFEREVMLEQNLSIAIYDTPNVEHAAVLRRSLLLL
jgi:hypothetical protein